MFFILSCQQNKKEVANTQATDSKEFQQQVEQYISRFAQQDSFNYMLRYTGGDPSKLNVWVLGQEPNLVKAGEDKVVRMNNDTYYKLAFVDLTKGPVKLSSKGPVDGRFVSFQLMDDRNANYHNVIGPHGDYLLYKGELPEEYKADSEGIKVPTDLSVVIVRVEVKDKNAPEDTDVAKEIFNGITIEGPQIEKMPELDLFKGFPQEVIARGNEILDSVFKVVPFRLTVAKPDQIGKQVPVVNHAAGTKGGWGGPVTSHSSYETIFAGENGVSLDASKGDWEVTFDAPKVNGFWSLTVYDTERGGYLHPNEEDRYHINNSTAVANENGSYTFLFKTKCEDGDRNCLEVPAGPFDVTARYYLPDVSIQNGDWELPKLRLIE